MSVLSVLVCSFFPPKVLLSFITALPSCFISCIVSMEIRKYFLFQSCPCGVLSVLNNLLINLFLPWADLFSTSIDASLAFDRRAASFMVLHVDWNALRFLISNKVSNFPHTVLLKYWFRNRREKSQNILPQD